MKYTHVDLFYEPVCVSSCKEIRGSNACRGQNICSIAMQRHILPKNFSYLLEICHASGAGGSAYTTLKRFLAVAGGTDNPFRAWLTQHHTSLKWKLPRENFHQLTAKRNDATERSRDNSQNSVLLRADAQEPIHTGNID